MKIHKFLLIGLLALPFIAHATNTPCSGKKGGISHCDSSTFVCNDGSTSASKKDCSVYMGGGSSASDKPINTVSPPIATPVSTLSGKVIRLDYEGFTVWEDCTRRGAVKFQYNAQHDTGSAKRSDNFYLDPSVPSECQQTRASAYGSKYDRGHLVPANHLDSSELAIKQTNFMTNILPQTANMNRGAWLLTEEIIECYRDISELWLLVVLSGGVIQPMTIF